MKAADGCTGAQRTLAEVTKEYSTTGRGAVQTQRLMQAATLMVERKSAIVVADGEGSVSGILTPKDVLHRAVAKGLDATTVKVGEVMTASPDLLTGEDTVLQALHQLSTGGYRSAPVVDSQGKPLGVLDVLHLVKAALSGSVTEEEVAASDQATESMYEEYTPFADPAVATEETPLTRVMGGPLLIAALVGGAAVAAIIIRRSMLRT